ncbi:methyltransferase domain-containing protein [Actinoplanes bogorensis]|uniref:Methyltransferase domain-containing protein n=1 Tax=Paractinoplanes bogorensis TaxID=1610840 RepID=A0ABS5YZY2_9ACTN|nr:methyltransferase domain-containing protein [Actinoplanes bogorensis]MBU2669010.1 methyltransferase domain-containing protein [Actinoplanes bogorensis]
MTDQIAYMNEAAATDAGRDYKRRLLQLLDVRAGQTVVDLGCGPGTDLGELAGAAGPGGRVIGVDREPDMLAEARRWHPEAVLHQGDVTGLPLADGTVDRARVDRVLQHVSDPARAIAEAARVLRTGGLFAAAEPDWDTLAVADEDLATSRAFARFNAQRVRNPSMGRDLVRLCTAAGLAVHCVEPMAVLFRDFGTADRILGLRRNSAHAVTDGQLAAPVREKWLERLEAGPLVAGFTLYLVTAGK